MLHANNSTSDRGGIISAEQMLISIFCLLTNRLRLPDDCKMEE